MENGLLSTRMEELAAQIALASDAQAAEPTWCELEQLLESAGVAEVEEIALPVLDRSNEDLRALLDGWKDGSLQLSRWDKGLLKRALKAYRKRLKLTRLDDSITGTHSPLSKGGDSLITGVRPPEQYPQEVWDLLIEQGKLRDGGNGLLELAII